MVQKFADKQWFQRITYIVCIPLIILGAFILGFGKVFTALGWLMMFEPKQALKQFKLP